MKHTLSILVPCIVFYTFNSHAMFQFDPHSTEQITTMLSDATAKAQKENLTQNPLAQVFTSMQDSIKKDGLNALAAEPAICRMMQCMYSSYKKDPNYQRVLVNAQNISLPQAHDGCVNFAAESVMSATIGFLNQSIAESSFKFPFKKPIDFKRELPNMFTFNEKADLKDRDVCIAYTLMLYYQEIDCEKNFTIRRSAIATPRSLNELTHS